jgi:hypothetical protein
MKKTPLIFLIALTIIFLNWSIYGQDAPGCRDHPLLSRMTDFYIQDCDKKEFDVYSFNTADGTVDIEGKKTFISHVVNDYSKAPSDLQIIKNFENALQKSGAVTEYKSKYDLHMNLHQGGKETWIHVHTWNDGEGYDLTIVEKASMSQDVRSSGVSEKEKPDVSTKPRDERFSVQPSSQPADIGGVKTPDLQTETKNAPQAGSSSMQQMGSQTGASQPLTGIGQADQASAGTSTTPLTGIGSASESNTGSSSQPPNQRGEDPQTASQTASIRLIYPNGGEELISGHTYNIRWESTGDPGPLSLSLIQYRAGMGVAQQGHETPRIIVARNFPNTGSLNWTATRTGGPPSSWKMKLVSPDAADETDGPVMIAPYIELYIGPIIIHNPVKKENWFLRTLKAVVTAGLSEAGTNTSVIREGIDYIKDDKDEGSGLKRGTDIIVEFPVMQFGTRAINERVLSRITIMELPSRAPIEVLACESKLQGPLISYVCRKRFKTTGPLFRGRNYLIEISVDPNKTIPEEELFRDNNIKTIEFELKP